MLVELLIESLSCCETDCQDQLRHPCNTHLLMEPKISELCDSVNKVCIVREEDVVTLDISVDDHNRPLRVQVG